MLDSFSQHIDAASHFFDNYLSLLDRHKIPEKKRRWYVEHIEDFIKERMFHFRPHLRLGPVPSFVLIAQGVASVSLGIGKIRGLWHVFTQHLALAGVGRVAPHTGFSKEASASVCWHIPCLSVWLE